MNLAVTSGPAIGGRWRCNRTLVVRADAVCSLIRRGGVGATPETKPEARKRGGAVAAATFVGYLMVMRDRCLWRLWGLDLMVIVYGQRYTLSVIFA